MSTLQSQLREAKADADARKAELEVLWAAEGPSPGVRQCCLAVSGGLCPLTPPPPTPRPSVIGGGAAHHPGLGFGTRFAPPPTWEGRPGAEAAFAEGPPSSSPLLDVLFPRGLAQALQTIASGTSK